MSSLFNQLGSFFARTSPGPEYGSQEWYKVTGRDPRWVDVDEWTFIQTHNTTSTSTHHSKLPSNEVLGQAFRHQEASGLPDISVSPAQGKFLQVQAKLVNAQHILEVGTLGGYSTLFLVHVSPTTRVTSIESDAHHARVARENMQMAGVDDRVEVIVGQATDVMGELLGEVEGGKRERFDFVFIDADKLNMWEYFDRAADMVRRPGGCIIVDNVVRRGSIVDSKLVEGGDETVLKVRELIARVGGDPRVDSTVLQMVGDKNYDGMLVAVVGR